MSKPDTKYPILPSAGNDRATRHTYVNSVIEPDPEFGLLRPQLAHMFRCDETGAIRKYGVEEVVLN